MKKKVKSIEP